MKEASVHTHSITLWPARWEVYSLKTTLTWTEFPFRPESKASIPESPGVYAFLIQPGVAAVRQSVLMYVGKTDRPLRQRFGEYLREAESAAARPELYRMLRLYRKYLVFSCAVLTPPDRPADVEAALLETFTPPANSVLPASVSRVINAF